MLGKLGSGYMSLEWSILSGMYKSIKLTTQLVETLVYGGSHTSDWMHCLWFGTVILVPLEYQGSIFIFYQSSAGQLSLMIIIPARQNLGCPGKSVENMMYNLNISVISLLGTKTSHGLLFATRVRRCTCVFPHQ